MTDSLPRIARDVIDCTRCPRLRAYGAEVARIKRRAYRDESYWGRPVPGFGVPDARVLLVGLAPGAHGAHRTGRMFTGDDSGNWLYAALYRAGLSNQEAATSAEDGLVLRGAYITATCRCAPPDNLPTMQERAACEEFLDRELEVLHDLRVIVALGRIAWEAVLGRAVRIDRASVPRPRPRFAHGASVRVPPRAGAGAVTLIGCYHPSRQNTNTGRLTRTMLDGVLHEAVALAG